MLSKYNNPTINISSNKLSVMDADKSTEIVFGSIRKVTIQPILWNSWFAPFFRFTPSEFFIYKKTASIQTETDEIILNNLNGADANNLIKSIQQSNPGAVVEKKQLLLTSVEISDIATPTETEGSFVTKFLISKWRALFIIIIVIILLVRILISYMQ